ncbi:MAG: 3'-5' exonuclease [Candidatus Gastranaerophilales bacterium]|nr:3'-5' exonuclease [Candidatus Gastranaerophilales bacterium]
MPRKKIIEIVLDVETTGLDYTREKMVEFAAVRLENGKIKDEFQTLINPEQHIRKSSIAIHGITEDMVKDAPTEAEIMPKIMEFIGEYPIVAHNAIFDWSYINEACLRQFGKGIQNQRIDSQMMFKEIYPDLESCGLEALMKKFDVKYDTRHRAMADTVGLAMAYPKLKKLYEKKYAWQLQQIDNVEYLFERYLRIQGAVQTLQAEMQDLKSIFKLYFEEGGEPITSTSGETLVYQLKHGFGYDFMEIKDVLDEIGALNKAVKLNHGFIDRLASGLSLKEEIKEKIKNARHELSETRNIQVLKPDRRADSNHN